MVSAFVLHNYNNFQLDEQKMVIAFVLCNSNNFL